MSMYCNDDDYSGDCVAPMADRGPDFVHAWRVDTPPLALGANCFGYRDPRSPQGALNEIEGQGGLR
jgi:hypothetical protein